MNSGLNVLGGSELMQAAINIGIKKAERDTLPTFVLSVLAGAFIALGGLMYLLVSSGQMGYVPTHLLGGLAFCLGLVLVVVAGGELFTSNVMLLMALMRRRIQPAQLARNWGLVLGGNLVGALMMVGLVLASGVIGQNDGQVIQAAQAVAAHKVGLSSVQAFFSSVLCNTLVCLAVWMTFAGRTLTDKVLAIVFPITAFVAVGFEHSVANMFILPLGHLLDPAQVPISGILHNLLFVLLGNVVGGGLFISAAYHLAYPEEA